MANPRARAFAAALVLTITATACTPIAWISGKTHGPIIEAGAARASLGIYRSPRLTTLSVGGLTITTNYLQYKFAGYLYDDLDDLRGALRDAEHNHDCLALTLISAGLYIKNWTHKSVGCQIGSIG